MVNEFENVSDEQLREQMRGISSEINQLEEDGWRENDSGMEYFDVGCDYFISDLSRRLLDIRVELIKRWSPPSVKDFPVCGCGGTYRVDSHEEVFRTVYCCCGCGWYVAVDDLVSDSPCQISMRPPRIE